MGIMFSKGRWQLICVISIEIGVNGDAYPAAVSQKVTKTLPVSFYSPMSGFKGHETTLHLINYGSHKFNFVQHKN